MSRTRTSTTAYVLPFGAFIALMAASQLLPVSMRYWIYPVQTILCGALIIRFWAFYPLAAPKQAGLASLTAVFVLLLWISPQVVFGRPGRFDGFNPDLFKDRLPFYYTFLAFRFARLVVIVPLIEEIFWRGFAARYLIKDDFESLPFGTFSRFSFAAVAIGFCIEHQLPDMPAGLATGLIYNWLAWRTRSLSSCVLAHAVTNLLLGVYIMRTGQWGFW